MYSVYSVVHLSMPRTFLSLILHMALAAIALVLAFVLRFDFGPIPPRYLRMLAISLPIALAAKGVFAVAFGLNRGLWRYVSVRDLVRILQAVGLASLVFVPVVLLVIGHGYPRSIYLLDFLVTAMLFGGVRLLGRQWIRGQAWGHGKGTGIRTLVVGAGDAGELVFRQLHHTHLHEYTVVGFVDDDVAKTGMSLHGVPILGTTERLATWLEASDAHAVVVAINDPPARLLRLVADACGKKGIPVRILPTFRDLMTGEIHVRPVRGLKIEDLLGRDPVRLDPAPVRELLSGQTVLVTGAGGSIGSELCRQIAAHGPRELILLELSENNLFEIEQELRSIFPGLGLRAELADIRDGAAMDALFARHRPSLVFHAAAHKHVPMMEAHPLDAARTNVFGTRNIVGCCARHGVERLLHVSTDKASSPRGVMGASKRVGEEMVREAALRYQRRFACVRFGNVLGSSGSVLPLFAKQIERGGPVRVTHPDATRYFMSIPEAVELILQANAHARPADVLILDMGEPVRILDLARNVIRLSGFRPDSDIRIDITGLRPGEKLHEELHAPSESLEASGIEKIHRLAGGPTAPAALDLAALEAACARGDAEAARGELFRLAGA